jgi:hypothetical protein
MTTTQGPTHASPTQRQDPAAGAGDGGARHEPVDRYAQQVWDIAMSSGLDPAAAAGVCRQAWWRLFDHLDELHTDTEICSWLCSAIDREAGLARHNERFSTRRIG